jgi:hypothetical protein
MGGGANIMISIKNTSERGFSKAFIIAGLVVFCLIAFIVGQNISADKGLAKTTEYTPSDAPAVMNDSEDLYRLIDNDEQFTALREDLGVFGRKNIKNYKSNKVVDVIFGVKNKATKKDNKISFEGKYEESKNTIAIVLTKLDNDRAYVSITDKKTKISIDSELPSNSKRNQFIGSLPLKKDTYSISYLKATDEFFIAINSGDLATVETAALTELKSQLGVKSLQTENVTTVGWDANGQPVTLPNPDQIAD